jgi:arginine/lysine/ornithine decarboxylase
MLLTRGPRIDEGRFESAARMVRSTSPAMPVLASIDACRQQMTTNGFDMLDSLLDLTRETRARLEALPGIELVSAARLGLPEDRVDPTRLVIGVNGLSLTGVEVERVLWDRFAIGVEMSDLSHVICLLTIGVSCELADRLVSAFTALSYEHTGIAQRAVPVGDNLEAVYSSGSQAISPRDAYFSGTRTIPFALATGEISAELVHPYPPGIPMLTPGEVITPEKIVFLLRCVEQEIQITGPADPSLTTIRVVDRPNRYQNTPNS